MLRYLVPTALVVVALACSTTNAEAPWFCHGLECPRYEVTQTHEEYEVREYPSDKWVSTIVEGYGYGAALSKGFGVSVFARIRIGWRQQEKLFKYISGANEQKENIKMTAPVRVLVHSSEGPFCKSNFTVSFFVPARHKMQDDPPKPTDKDVFIEITKPFKAYVAQYGGWNTEDRLVAKAAQLYKQLADEGISVMDSEYYSAGYDPPFRLLHRHNEVWLIGKDGDSKDSSGSTIHQVNAAQKNVGMTGKAS